jgi:hypothetical protein
MAITEGGKFSPVQQIVSPGVFTRENDLSGLAQGVANIGGAIVAPFADGPAFIPTLVNNVADLEEKFGTADGIYYGPYTAKEYLIEQGIVTIVRVGGLTGYWQKNPLVLYAEPGYWTRNSEVGAVTTASFMYLDSDAYTDNIQLELSSSAINSTELSASSRVTVARASNAEINTFLTNLGVSAANNTLVSASLATSASLGKVLKVTTSQYFTDFSASVVTAGNTVAASNSGNDYVLANYDFEKSHMSGSISSSVSDTNLLEFDTNVFGGTGVLNYLSNSYTFTAGNITYGLVMARGSTSNAADFSSATISVAEDESTIGAAFRYNTSQLIFSGSTNVKFGVKASTSAYESGYVGTGTLSGSVLYADKQLNAGTVTSGFLTRSFASGGPSQSGAAGEFFLTSSAYGSNVTAETYISTAIAESTETTAKISSSLLYGISAGVDPDVISFNGSLTYSSASFKTLRGTATCSSGLQFTGLLIGEFGTYSGNFVSQDDAGSDPCNPITSVRNKLVLGVLANTQNGSTQFNERYEVFGFKTSTLAQQTSSAFPYVGLTSPTENAYQLILNYSFANDDGTTAAGVYGYYDFTLNSNDNLYIKNVFGDSPTAGDPAKQISGQKIEAAYSYVLFEDSISKFKSEKTFPTSKGGGWRFQASTAPSDGFSEGEALKFVDQYSLDPNSGDSAFAITNAKTPWVYSQAVAPFKGSASATAVPTKFKLFKVHTMADGTKSNTKFKVEISKVKLAGTVPGSEYGSFTLSIRSYSDTDKRPKYVETFQNLNLDSNSANYVARRIGDRYSYITFAGKVIEYGTYINLSKHVRIEMNNVSWPVTSVPYGFEAYNTPVDSTLSAYIPAVRYSKASIYGQGVGKYASGTVFGEVPGSDDEIRALYPTSSLNVGVANDTKQYFKSLPYYGSNDQNGTNVDFDLEQKTYGETNSTYYANSTGSLLAPSLSGSIPSTFDAVNEPTYVKMRKFVFGFQGGFDGQWPAIPLNVGSDITAGNTQGLDCTSINSPGSIGYKQCIAALGNADEFDINMVILPGIFRSQHSYVTELTIDMCEARGDCFYIMDNVVFPASNQSTGLIDAAINSVASIDSNYVGTYYPWVKVLDTNLNKIVSVPPSVVLPAVFAANDNSAAEWYAPAGLNRGGISTAVQVLDRVTHLERDTLYEGRVNPIAAFPGQGICVWGQKTLQVDDSALDRINVRRLLINLKKFIASSSKYLVFEQNVASTRNRFLAIVNPYLESVQQRNGLYAYQVKMDNENNSPDLIDRNILYGQIFLQPTRTAEFIVLDFNVLPTGASFS